MKSLLILGVLLCVALCVRSAAIETLEATKENIQPYVSVEAEPELALPQVEAEHEVELEHLPQEEETAVIEEQQETGDQDVAHVRKTVKFGQLCSGNPSNRRRIRDKWGYGHYGADRGDGRPPHRGLDIACRDGATVYAPFDVTLHGRYYYPEKPEIYDGINLRGEGLCFKLFFVRPDKTTGRVRKGQKIGTVVPMQQAFPGITSHTHVQMCNASTDPTRYF